RVAARHQSTALIIRWRLDLFDALFKIQSRLGWRPMNTQPKDDKRQRNQRNSRSKCFLARPLSKRYMR
ncbi:MAG TPA: hypothetical protein VIH54_09275, partial [Chthoniobacterales bacterium]